MERSKAFYAGTLGLPPVDARGFPEYQLGENVSLYLIDLSKVGQVFSGPHTSTIALRVAEAGTCV